MRGLFLFISLATLGVVWFVEYNGCQADDSEVLSTLRANGLRDVRLGGTKMGACHDNEASRTFIAINAQGEHVSGVVCCGQFTKSCTVRW